MRGLCVTLMAVLVAGEVLAGTVQSTRTLRAGTILEAGDMVASAGEAEEQLESFVGLEVRKTIYPGRAINATNLGPPTLIQRNDVVMMSYQQGALNLRTEGRALGAGGLGERIEVMNLDTRLTVRARVTGRLQVRVGP